MIFHHNEYSYTARDGRVIENGPDDIRWRDEFRHKYDSAMAELLDSLGETYCDESTGDVEAPDGYCQRFGRRILTTDDRGFVGVIKCEGEDLARITFSMIENAYDAWADGYADDGGEWFESETPAPYCEIHNAYHRVGDLTCEIYAAEGRYNDKENDNA